MPLKLSIEESYLTNALTGENLDAIIRIIKEKFRGTE
jgi:hypothetical protein